MESAVQRSESDADSLSLPPPRPRQPEDAGLGIDFLSELLLKDLHDAGVLQLGELADRSCLPGGVLEPVLAMQRREALIEVRGPGERGLRYALTDKGRAAATAAFVRDGYLGPAPITLEHYWSLVRSQSVTGRAVNPDAMVEAFADAVISRDMLDRLGPALHSGRALFIYGHPGTGKSFVARRLARVFNDSIYIPYAVLVGNVVVRVFEPSLHKRMDGDADHSDSLAFDAGYDRRLVRCRRPTVIAGGELSVDMLELQYDPVTRRHQAPLQLMSNNGVLLIDDLGRQRSTPAQILNRWIVPMEEGRDFLHTAAGQHFELPFDQVLVFSTNMDPHQLADAAFLRRIGHKIPFRPATEAEYSAIWQMECNRRGVPYDPRLVEYVIDAWHLPSGIPMLPCHPRDILGLAMDRCRYLYGDQGVFEGSLDTDALNWAWRSYFIDDEQRRDSQ